MVGNSVLLGEKEGTKTAGYTAWREESLEVSSVVSKLVYSQPHYVCQVVITNCFFVDVDDVIDGNAEKVKVTAEVVSRWLVTLVDSSVILAL